MNPSPGFDHHAYNYQPHEEGFYEDEDDYDAFEYYDRHGGTCPECDGEGSGRSACIDDLCRHGHVPCMHGDYRMIRCGTCGA